MTRRAVLAPAMLAGLIWASGCGDATDPVSPPPPPPPPPRATTVSVTPAAAELTALGQTVQLSAEVRDQHGQAMTTVTVTWSSASPAVATVDASGLVTAVGDGTATISATAGDASGEAAVTVMQSANSVVVTPSAATVAQGDTVRLVAEAFDENGNAVEDAEFAWSSSDGSVATVTDSGLVRGVSEGTATINATSDDASAIAEITVENPDRAALVALYNATNGPQWINNNNWLTDEPLVQWHGVDTNASGRVWLLDLRGNELSGRIPPELGNLANLTHLLLSGNQLVGPIPPELGNLANLRDLWLQENQLAGRIPPELGNLANLTQLLLSGNQLAGPIPTELGNLTNLTGLWLTGNELTGPIPTELGNLTNLTELWLTGNELTGPIPTELGNLVNLNRLNLWNNGLTGPIPTELGNLTNLTGLWLAGNELTGPIPPGFVRLERLRDFYIGGNESLCVPGTSAFVAWLRGIANRGVASDDHCNAVDVAVLKALFEAAGGTGWDNSDGWPGDGAVDSWHGVTADTLGHVTALDLSRNGLAGRLPANLGDLRRMTELRVDGNAALSGRLPLSLASLSFRALHYAGTDLCVPRDSSFRAWLDGVESHEGTGAECARLSDREILVALYDATDGPNWTNNENWLSEAPLDKWHGVEVDRHGRVVGLRLLANRLRGSIPVELGSLTHLRRLGLDRNYERLTGPIPPELGNLSSLRALSLSTNALEGPIPPELGNLTDLLYLSLEDTDLEGSIPPELGNLVNLSSLNLEGIGLEGSLPAELANLVNLKGLLLSDNRLTGPIPAGFGNLVRLAQLSLGRNRLQGSLPVQLGRLANLQGLYLGNNALAGAVPPEFGGLTRLREFSLSGNADMSGALPLSLTGLGSLETLATGGTGLCAPSDPGFLTWLGDLPNGRVRLCKGMPAVAYIVQAVQSREFPVPLVAGEEALLRVFPTAARANQESLPPVRASFYLNGGLEQVVEIPGKAGPIPTEVDEGSLAGSANAVVPGDIVRPGLEMVIEVDPDGALEAGLGVAKRIPGTGRLAVDVRDMPLFDLTVIPFLWATDPDSAILEQTRGMAAEPDGHELLDLTRILLPVADLAVAAHEPVLSSSNDGYALLNETAAIRALEGGSGHFMGMMSGLVTGADGLARGRVSFSVPAANIIVHELGHNMSLQHAPCGGALGQDPAFPYGDGGIGAWGYDFRGGGSLKGPEYKDIMSACSPDWISDYHFSKMLRFRLADEENAKAARATGVATRSLLLWGGVDSLAVPHLEPAFVVDAPAALPPSPGDHRITGRTAGGAELFSLSFTMPETADGDGNSSFAFALPVRSEWGSSLASITLAGPGGSFTLSGDSDFPMAILRNPRTGQVRGILRDLPPATQAAMNAAGQAGGPALEMLFSRGIPRAEEWRR